MTHLVVYFVCLLKLCVCVSCMFDVFVKLSACVCVHVCMYVGIHVYMYVGIHVYMYLGI